MSYSNGLVLAPARNYPSTGDIQKALADTTGTGDLGTLCTHPNINKFAKYKPNAIQGYTQPSDSLLLANKYGLVARSTRTRNNLISMSLGWTYEGAQSPYYRQLDFDGYYNGAPVPFMQTNGTTLLLDLVSGNASPALFYMLMNDGALANKPFVAGQGIGSSGTAVPSNRLAYCIAVEDLGFDDATATIMGATLGLVIFQGTTYKGEVWASQTVAHLSSRVNEMFNVPTNTLNLAAGNYTAVACAKLTSGGLTYYMPVYDDANYPARFDFVVGGIDYWKQDRTGLATSQGGTYSTMLNTNADDIYVKMKLYNQTGRSVSLANVTNGRFILSTRVQGSRVDMQTGNTIPIDRTQTSSLVLPTTDPTIADGSYVEMVFKLLNIWSNTAGSQVASFTSGSLDISPSIQFYSGGTATDFGQYGNPQVLTVRYS